jgi:hypothetical protein
VAGQHQLGSGEKAVLSLFGGMRGPTLDLTEDLTARLSVRIRPCAADGLGDQRSAGLTAVYWAVRYCAVVMLTKWFLLTRLETRTKESDIYASIWVQNPDAQ